MLLDFSQSFLFLHNPSTCKLHFSSCIVYECVAYRDVWRVGTSDTGGRGGGGHGDEIKRETENVKVCF